MINMPLSDIKEKIAKEKGISEEEINSKIKAKLDQLSGLISEEGAAHIVANELGVKLFEQGAEIKISKLLPGMKSVSLNAKVLQIYEIREFKTEKYEGKVGNMLIGDESGICRLVMWNDKADFLNQVNEGDVIRLTNSYVKENTGRNELHLGNSSKIIVNPEGVTVDVKPRDNAETTEAIRKNIANISENDSNIEVLATIVQVFDINFFEVCPDCNKRVRLKDDSFVCPTHGAVEPQYNYVLNLYLDDGTDNIRSVLWREQIEELLGMNRAQITAFKEDPSKFEIVKNDLLGNIILMTGKANKNQNFDRIEFVASKINNNPNPDEEIKKLKEQGAEETPKPAVPSEKPVVAEPTPSTPSSSSSAMPADDSIEDIDLDKELMDIEDI